MVSVNEGMINGNDGDNQMRFRPNSNCPHQKKDNQNDFPEIEGWQ